MHRVAAIQMCSHHIVKDNLQAAGLLIKEAAEKGAQLVVLPEMFAIMGDTAHAKVHVKEKMGEGIIQDFLSAQAKENNLWIVGGTIPITAPQTEKVYAASFVYDNRGNQIAQYNKIHLFDAVISDKETYLESETTEAGKQLIVADSPVGKLGLGVCYDVRFPEMFRHLAHLGAEIITLPSAFTVPTGTAHWEVLTRSRAIENFCYVIAAAQGGTHSNGRKTYGHSMIIDPWGNIMAQKTDTNPGIIYADIDLTKLHAYRKSIPIAAHQRIFLDLGRL